MPLPEIILDDRRFEAIVKEATERIPRYTKEWTDFNESDPGITLLQLFSWLTEMILYRLNQVPEKNYLKFLELIGVELRPPVPARAELTFKLSRGASKVVIPQGTRVQLAEQTGGGGPVIFETDDSLLAIGAELKAIQAFDGARYRPVTESNRVQGRFFYALSERPQKGSALYLGFNHVFPSGRHQVFFRPFVDDLIAEGKGLAADSPEPPPPAIAFWEYWNGIAWVRLDVVSDGTRHLAQEGRLVFNFPELIDETLPPDRRNEEEVKRNLVVKVGALSTPQSTPLFWVRYRVEEILGGGFDRPPRLEDVLLNTIGATHAFTVKDELMAASDGSPNQAFQLANPPVLEGTLELEVREGDSFALWTRVRDFGGSTREDKHYTVELATGIVRFGDGEHGAIPPSSDVPNIRARRYRSGGGVRGNAGAGKITSLQTSIAYVDSVTNLRPSYGGEDEESVESAKMRAPFEIRSRSRAVTREDFEFLARRTPGARIKRARALPTRHPEFEPFQPSGGGVPEAAVAVPGVVTVVVIPDSVHPKPMPSLETLHLVTEHLREHALITTEIYAAAPRYREVRVEAQVIARPTVSSGEVQQSLEKRLLNYFHPLHGGERGEGWEFGEKIYFSQVYRQILEAEGVLRLEAGALTIFVDGVRQPDCADVPLAPDEVVFSTKHSVVVRYAT